MSATDIVKAVGLGLLLSVVLFVSGYVVGRCHKPKGESGQIQTCKQGDAGCTEESIIQLPF